MILTKLYRLQKKKGAVLFVVIAMMTLLVIMATTAYMTARSSYKTVINNYDFSQLYLSAVSVSDMMVGAVTNDTVDKGTGAKNNFTELKDAVLELKVSESIKVKSSNITTDMDTAEKILAGTVNNPVEKGVLDAVEVSILLESTQTKDKITGNPDDKGIDYLAYLFTTTAYYRNNTISIQDRVIRETGEKENNLFDTFFTATGKRLNGDNAENDLSRCAIIDVKEISDDAYFENEYTVFKSNTGDNWFLGGLTSSGNVWLEAFRTNIPAPDTPSVSKDKWGEEDEDGKKKYTKEPDSRNDWFIGGSLITSGNAGTLDLNGNNLVIKGDLIIAGWNGCNIKADNIYVMGNIIDLAGSSFGIDANVYVNGAVVTSLNLETINDSDTAEERDRKERHNKIKQSAIDTMTNTNMAYRSTRQAAGVADPGNIEGYDRRGNSTKTTTYKSLHVNQDADFKLLAPGYAASSGTWTPTTDIVPVGYQVAEGINGYVDYVNYSQAVETAVTGQTERNNYVSYSASPETMKKTLKIDFDNLVEDTDASGNGLGTFRGNFQPYYFDDSGVQQFALDKNGSPAVATVYVNASGNGMATVSLPYVDNGYVLDLDFGTFSYNHQDIEYTIDSGDSNESMLPIVLKANFNDGKGQATDRDGYNAFAWNIKRGVGVDDIPGDGDVYHGDSGHSARVKITGSGDVFFELGNYDPLDTTELDDNKKGTNGQNEEYWNFEAGKGLCTATYYTTEFSQIGTANQLAAIAATEKSGSAFKALLSNSDPLPQYDNQVMIISNKSGGIAYHNPKMNAMCFGYLYAPFGDYYNWDTSYYVPFFGGMIVSNYTIMQTEYIYAEPDPQLMDNLEEALPKKDLEPDSEEGKWHVKNPDLGAGSNFLG